MPRLTSKERDALFRLTPGEILTLPPHGVPDDRASALALAKLAVCLLDVDRLRDLLDRSRALDGVEGGERSAEDLRRLIADLRGDAVGLALDLLEDAETAIGGTLEAALRSLSSVVNGGRVVAVELEPGAFDELAAVREWAGREPVVVAGVELRTQEDRASVAECEALARAIFWIEQRIGRNETVVELTRLAARLGKTA